MTSCAETVMESSRHVVAAEVADARDVAEFFARHDEVATQAWQCEEHFRHVLGQPGTIALVARSKEGQLVGALIGGVLGTRGMINHVAVDVDHRGEGNGRRLVHGFECALSTRGIRRYFLFASRDDASAQRFWMQQGCSDMTGTETTYERDL